MKANAHKNMHISFLGNEMVGVIDLFVSPPNSPFAELRFEDVLWEDVDETPEDSASLLTKTESNAGSPCKSVSAQFSGFLKSDTNLWKKKRCSVKERVHSRYCHVCVRPRWRAEILECSNMATTGCSKVICKECILHNGSSLPSNAGNFVCFHCDLQCPSNATCRIYSKVNAKRRKHQSH
mmetsp:Transcript_11148/g.20142  ORF Transcript_11148/g.20142 Transcript_11148/m.20142 type:complete len:180 (-) Transcript_11148:85-624(-)